LANEDANDSGGWLKMNVLVYLLPMALGLGLAGLLAFLWSLKSNQYDDMEGAALRPLSDEDI
jgi:cbb3-type cytochrome oxidase maturation protein